MHRRRRAFRALGTRFLQLPLGEVEHVDRPAPSWWRDDRERSYGRPPDELRPVTIEPGFVRTATGSALISLRRDPRDLHRVGPGVRAEVDGRPGPRLGHRRVRDAPRVDRRPQAARRLQGPPDGRTVEIQRLIGRSLRGVVDFEALGERTIYIDCDVLQADGGPAAPRSPAATSRSSSRCRRLVDDGKLTRCRSPARVAAVSCGIVDGTPLLDLDYPEDSSAEVDANVVMTGDGGLVEVQATAERTPLSRAHLDELLALAQSGIEQLRAAQAPPSRARGR